MTFSTGHIPDLPEIVKRRVGMHMHPAYRTIRATALPMQTTNRLKLLVDKGGPGILNQHDVGGCEGCGHAEAGTLRLANLGVSRGLISNTALYLGALLVDRQIDVVTGQLSVVTDTGTMPSSIQAGWQTFGARLAADDPQCPMQSSSLYVTPSDSNSPLILPAPETLYADSPYRYGGTYFIQTVGCQKVLDLMTTHASGRTCTDAIPASGSQFQSYTGGVIGALDGPVDHCNHLLDYSWTGSAADFSAFVSALQQGAWTTAMGLAMAGTTPNLVFYGQNSWDITWGESDVVSRASGGLYRANINHVNQAEDLCVVDISAAS
jgi:hypothetical protein